MDRRVLLQMGSVLSVTGATVRGIAAGTDITSSVMAWTLRGTFQERLEIAAKSGVQSVELVGEYAAWTPSEMDAMRKLATSFGLRMDTVIATPDWGKRPVSVVDPAQRDNFLADVRKSIDAAKRLEVPQIILMSGNVIPGRTYEEQFESLVEGTRRAGDLAAAANLTIIVEPLNSRVNHKGFFLTTCGEGLRLIKQVNHPHVKLLFDIYHEQVQSGNVIAMIEKAAPDVAVFHVADNPGRHDPGTGELNYDNIYQAIRKTGFRGYVTMEYLPVGDPVQSLVRALNGMRQSLAS